VPKGSDAPPAADDAALAAAGVDGDEADPGVLLPLAGRTAELDRAIVARLTRAPSAAGAAALQHIAAGATARGWKVVVKDVRRALYRFTQRGVAVPAAPPAAATTRPATPALEGHLSPIDGRGDRLLWLVRPRREGGVLVMTGVLNEPEGLRDVTLAEMARKTLRRMGEDMRTRHHLRMVRAPGAYVDALLSQGFARARAAGIGGIGEYPTHRARLTSADPAPLEPPLIARLSDAPAVAPETAADVTTLLAEPEFATWPLDRPVLAPYLAELEGVRESPLVLSQAQQQERARAIVAKAVGEIFAGATAAAYRRRLEEMAYYFHASARPAAAAAACATAAAIAAAGGGTGVLFLEELAHQGFARFTAAATEHAREQAESSLLVTPAALRREQARRNR
jgi:hypothetical protein